VSALMKLEVPSPLKINDGSDSDKKSPKNSDPLHSLDFSTLHHQVESNEPIGYTRVHLGGYVRISPAI